MSEYCHKLEHQKQTGKMLLQSNCPYCESDRLNKEINRLRQYEDAVTSAVDGTLLVWNLMSTNHTVIKNDYWQNHLEEIDRLEAELTEARAEVDNIKQVEFPRRIEKLRAEARQEVARECIAIVDSYIGTDHICAEIAETFGLEE